MVDVQERRLRSFQEHAATRGQGVVHEAHGVADVGGQAGGVLLQVALGDLVGGEGQAVVDLGQHEVLLFQDDIQLLAEDLGVEQVLARRPMRAALSA